MLCNYTWFFAALRAARRDRVYSIPAFCTLFWLVGDTSFLWHFDRWFHYYKNWYVELFWVALIFTPVVLGYQGWTYWVFRKRLSRSDIVPAGHTTPPVTGPESVEPVGGRS